MILKPKERSVIADYEPLITDKKEPAPYRFQEEANVERFVSDIVALGALASHGQVEFDGLLDHLMSASGMKSPLQRYEDVCPAESFGELHNEKYKAWAEEMNTLVDQINGLFERRELTVEIVKEVSKKAAEIKKELEAIRKQSEE